MLHAAHVHGLMANAVHIGVDQGPDLSITGSLATILWILALRKEGLDLSFWRFLQAGVVVMPVVLLRSLGGAILRNTFHLTRRCGRAAVNGSPYTPNR